MTVKDTQQGDSNGADELKARVRDHWEDETCGTRYSTQRTRKDYFDEIRTSRYERTPYIKSFADFANSQGKSVLEIGVGAGSDFYHWVANGANVIGMDLTESALKLTREHLQLGGFDASRCRLVRSDAEHLPFDDNVFDIVYSYGVLHHTPNTSAAFAEVFRVLKPGGQVRAMIYHVPSWTGLFLWTRYSLLRLCPWQPVKEAIFRHLESPGTKAYTLDEAREMLANIGYQCISVCSRLCPGDLLQHKPSQKYQGYFYRVIWRLYPRWIARLCGDRFGLNLLIYADKPSLAAKESVP